MDSVLSSKELQKLKDYFAVLDTDADGKITKSEAVLIVRGIGIPGLDDDFDTVIKGMSANESELCVEDVMNIALSLKKTQTNDYESIVQVFKMFDKNQDGTVLASDLRQILSHLGEVIPEDEIDALFRRLGYSDVIRYEDFAKVLLMSDECAVCCSVSLVCLALHTEIVPPDFHGLSPVLHLKFPRIGCHSVLE